MLRIALGADAYGFPLKETVKAYLQDQGYPVGDFGVAEPVATTPYYEIAHTVAQRLVHQEFDRGILVCGTGMGMAIIANKHAGIYAAVCESRFAAEKSRSINNANILTLGALVTTDAVAKDIVDVWLNTGFTSGWEPAIQEWLRGSLPAIAALEQQQFTVQ